MFALAQKQEESIGLNQTLSNSQFSCNICRHQAEQPVVAKCGHLFCWHCVQNQSICKVCKNEILEEDFVPIYTNEDSKNLRNAASIKNSASLGSANEFSALFSALTDNIQRETMLAGNGYCPATVFTVMGDHDEYLEELQNEGKETKRKFTLLSWCLLFLVFLCAFLSLKMEKEGK